MSSDTGSTPSVTILLRESHRDGRNDHDSIHIAIVSNANQGAILRHIARIAIPGTTAAVQGIDGRLGNANGNSHGRCNPIISTGHEFFDGIVIEPFEDKKAFAVAV